MEYCRLYPDLLLFSPPAIAPTVRVFRKGLLAFEFILALDRIFLPDHEVRVSNKILVCQRKSDK